MRDPYDIPAHPYAAMLPRDDEGIPALSASIGEVGLLEPIVIHEDKVLDGLRRLKACKHGGHKPKFVQFDPRTMGDPVAFVLAKNAHRRNADRNKDYVGLVRVYVKKHYENTNRRIALACNVSPTTVSKVRRSLEESDEIPATEERIGSNDRHFDRPPAAQDADQPGPAENDGADDADGDQNDDVAPERPASTTTEQVLCDVNGRVIPGHLRDVFADDFYASFSRAIESFVRRAEGRKNFYRKILACQGFADLSRALMGNLKRHTPHAVCHVCGGAEGAGCTECASSGWLSSEEALAHVYNPEDEEDDDGR